MPPPPAPRFTDLSDFEAYLRTSANSVPKQTILPIILSSAETMVERYCRRRFAPDPPLRTDYTRQVVQVAAGTTLPPQVTGTLALTWGGQTATLALPVTAAALQAALVALSAIGARVACSGGPLPSYPISVTWAGSLTGEQPLISADSSGLSGGYAVVTDAGFDSNPPVAKRFSTRGRSEISVPDLRSVDASPDPRIPNSGGVVLYGRRLFASQYDLGYQGYAAAGADEAIGDDYAEPATEIKLGYGYGVGLAISQQFAFVLPIGRYPNDLTITGRWGWNPAPPDIVEATYAVASRGWAERDARFTDAYQTAEGAILQFYKQLPARVKGVLDSYRRVQLAFV